MSKLNLLAIDIGHNINYDTGAADIRNEDFFLSIHHNAGGGHGA